MGSHFKHTEKMVVLGCNLLNGKELPTARWKERSNAGRRLFQGSELLLTGTSALVNLTENKQPEEFLGPAPCCYKRLQSPRGPKSWHELQCWGHPGLIYCSGHSFIATLPPTTSPSLLYSALAICKSSWVIIIIMIIPILWPQPKGQADVNPKRVSSTAGPRAEKTAGLMPMVSISHPDFTAGLVLQEGLTWIVKTEVRAPCWWEEGDDKTQGCTGWRRVSNMSSTYTLVQLFFPLPPLLPHFHQHCHHCPHH